MTTIGDMRASGKKTNETARVSKYLKMVTLIQDSMKRGKLMGKVFLIGLVGKFMKESGLWARSTAMALGKTNQVIAT
jgi:hypothetical protein